MDVMFTHCAGFDVRKKTVTACRVTQILPGGRRMGSWSSESLGQ